MGKVTERRLGAESRKNASISAVENLLDFIVEDHPREREVWALIDRLVLAASLNDVEMHQTPADEEIDLLPMMLVRCDPEEEIKKVIDKLNSDHGQALADAPAIVAFIQGLEAPHRKFSEDECK